jgi:hypothetical protein
LFKFINNKIKDKMKKEHQAWSRNLKEQGNLKKLIKRLFMLSSELKKSL